MDKCAVYLMQDGYSGDVKIGISNNPELRRTKAQSHYNVGGVSLIDQTWFLTREEAHEYEKLLILDTQAIFPLHVVDENGSSSHNNKSMAFFHG